jgi:hypothetical protein
LSLAVRGGTRAGTFGPEGVLFISADDSPSGKPLLAVAHEVSGSTVLYEIEKLTGHR